MKSVKILSVFGFLLVINLFLYSTVSAQVNTNTNSTQKSADDSNPSKIVPVQTTGVQPNMIVKSNEERYRIGLHDVLAINVYRHPELSQANLRIDDSGYIRMPRIDTPISALCKTENELAAEIIELYKKNYLRDPYVTVFVSQQNSQPLSVIGAVEKPGSFFTNRRLTLLELISYAGGPDVEFAGTKVQVARVGDISGCAKNDKNANTNDEGVTFFGYELAEVLKGKSNPVMKPGDIVVVLEADPIYVTGNVKDPKPIPLKQKMTLTQAIAAAGGMLPASKQSKIILHRQTAGSQVKQELTYDLKDIQDKKIPDPVLIANDIVEVPTDKIKDFRNNFIKAVTGGIGNIFLRIPGTQ